MVLVTGATGFLGSELVSQLLRNGERVRAIKRPSSVIPEFLRNESLIEWANADLLDYFSLDEAVQGINKVYHCAALVSLNPRDKKKMLRVNVGGTVNLLNVCSANHIKKILHVSSVAAVGDSKKGELITETHHWEYGSGKSGYSISKYESEMEVFRAAAEGMNIVIVNPSIILGKNAGEGGSGQLFEMIRKGMRYYPDGSFGYVDVKDVAMIMIKLMNSEISGNRFIINAENWTYKELFSEIAAKMGKNPPDLALKPWMLEFVTAGAAILSSFTGKDYGLNKDTVRNAFKKQNFSNEKIKKALDLEFRSLKETISEICQNLYKN